MRSFVQMGLILLFGSAPLHAGPPKSCELFLKPLPLNANLTLRAGEKERFGAVLPAGVALPALSEGPYVFIIDSKKNVVIAPRFPDLNEAQPLVTHRSLLNELRKTLGEEPKLIALGEINIDNGQISSITNKAGTSFMPDEALPAVARYLKSRGLPVTPETPLIPHGEVQTGHDTEMEAALFRIRVQKDPALRALNERLMKFRKEIQVRFPNRSFPGQVDWYAFLQSPKPPLNRLKMEQIHPPEMAFLSSMNWLENYADRYRVLPLLQDRFSLEAIKTVIDEIDRFEGIFSKTSP